LGRAVPAHPIQAGSAARGKQLTGVPLLLLTQTSMAPDPGIPEDYGLRVDIMPVMLATGLRLFDGPDLDSPQLEKIGAQKVGRGRVSASGFSDELMPATDAAHFSNAFDRDLVRGGAVRNGILVGAIHHRIRRLLHELLKSTVHTVFAPPLALDVLCPLEVRDRYAAAASQNVGHDGDPARRKRRVGLRRGREVGHLEYQVRLDAAGVVHSDRLLECGRYKHVASDADDVFTLDGVCVLEPDDAAGLLLVLEDFAGVEPSGLWIAPLESDTATTR
jgi:hypothetical protein